MKRARGEEHALAMARTHRRCAIRVYRAGLGISACGAEAVDAVVTGDAGSLAHAVCAEHLRGLGAE